MTRIEDSRNVSDAIVAGVCLHAERPETGARYRHSSGSRMVPESAYVRLLSVCTTPEECDVMAFELEESSRVASVSKKAALSWLSTASTERGKALRAQAQGDSFEFHKHARLAAICIRSAVLGKFAGQGSVAPLQVSR